MGVHVLDLAQYRTADALALPLFKQASDLGFVYLRCLPDFNRDVDHLFGISEHFFLHEQMEAKRACARTASNMGYAGAGEEVLDPKQHDEKELINIGLFHDGQPQQPLPPLLAARIADIDAFLQRCRALAQMILEAFAIAMGLPRDLFAAQHEFTPDNATILRLLHYPRGHVTRAGAHSDYGSITLLFQRKVGGLQVLPPRESPSKEEAWMEVEPLDDAVLVNVGDALEFWTGCRLKSTLHRVTAPPDGNLRERFSIALFYQPVNSAVLKNVLPDNDDVSAVDIERMERKGVKRDEVLTSGQHLQARLQATYR